VLELAYLNSYYQTGLKNLLDVAVLEHAEVSREIEPAKNFHQVDEIPFDFNRRRMSVVVAEHDAHHLLITKGAVEEMLTVCTAVRHGETQEPLTPELLTRIRAVTADLNKEGLDFGDLCGTSSLVLLCRFDIGPGRQVGDDRVRGRGNS